MKTAYTIFMYALDTCIMMPSSRLPKTLNQASNLLMRQEKTACSAAKESKLEIPNARKTPAKMRLSTVLVESSVAILRVQLHPKTGKATVLW